MIFIVVPALAAYSADCEMWLFGVKLGLVISEDMWDADFFYKTEAVSLMLFMKRVGLLIHKVGINVHLLVTCRAPIRWLRWVYQYQ